MDATPTVRLSEAIFYLEACRRVIADGQTLNAAHLDKAIQAFVEVRELLTADPRDE